MGFQEPVSNRMSITENNSWYLVAKAKSESCERGIGYGFATETYFFRALFPLPNEDAAS